ncbi:MAG: hypothetical protein AUJ92_07215 [Armatimonadetes bacterium CG2_30_59_28]|nr:hypothetical protein [Armatimonadota bacterium]OIO95877.1 MAG: hypothetical protein AUJ92_07215 [Armatimonadetes bacterium CG2_30_59_28]PIU67421.1 MAG: hypothetical protein COS85_00705 [Armatimonadetes bacterium CG07_land_8_20_14_0_80_59_28]
MNEVESRVPAPLLFKPDLTVATRRWEAYFAGEVIDRPLVCVTAPIEGKQAVPLSTYAQRAHGDLDDAIDRALINAEATWCGGEVMPAFWLSFGCDEIAAFCGSELVWGGNSGNTTWSKSFVNDWAECLPLRLQEDHPLWQRMLSFYRKAADRLEGKMLLKPLDLHTNMDLLAAVRNPQRLCMDMIDQPEMIDRAMNGARAIFREVWEAIAAAGRMDELGDYHDFYSREGAACLQCDFSCMMSPEMFRRWVLPALEAEASVVQHALYHWDGPGALAHTNDLLAARGLHTLSYVPGAGHGEHIDHLDLMKRVQAGGKSVSVAGTPEQLKLMHRELRPEKAMYWTHTKTIKEGEELLRWFVRNT